MNYPISDHTAFLLGQNHQSILHTVVSQLYKKIGHQYQIEIVSPVQELSVSCPKCYMDTWIIFHTKTGRIITRCYVSLDEILNQKLDLCQDLSPESITESILYAFRTESQNMQRPNHRIKQFFRKFFIFLRK